MYSKYIQCIFSMPNGTHVKFVDELYYETNHKKILLLGLVNIHKKLFTLREKVLATLRYSIVM